MWQRIVTGAIGGAGFLAVLYVGGNLYLAAIVLLATIALREICEMVRISSLRVESLLATVYLWLLLFSMVKPKLLPAVTPFAATVGFIFVGLLWTVFSRNRATFHTIGYLLTGALYVGIGFAFMAQTRFLTDGFVITLLILFSTWASDSGALFIGKAWGKRKLAPVVSPNKTIAGSLGAIASAMVVGTVFWLIVRGPYTLSYTLFLSAVISVFGQLGDLIESALKRTNDVKDSGRILPGHGGVLDRFDSLIYSFIFLYLFQLIG
ncbi:phosphatidate cytidylyltransferase [Numidum massiliense]|uniref:phosphatidate cytidylyltransferase n=1 Tax=Numidum massiliense TaxID=1522315 RepID=UPI0006D59D43|nr:phosphatidate cytidylyltransferase [Numidum massiliense]